MPSQPPDSLPPTLLFFPAYQTVPVRPMLQSTGLAVCVPIGSAVVKAAHILLIHTMRVRSAPALTARQRLPSAGGHYQA